MDKSRVDARQIVRVDLIGRPLWMRFGPAIIHHHEAARLIPIRFAALFAIPLCRDPFRAVQAVVVEETAR